MNGTRGAPKQQRKPRKLSILFRRTNEPVVSPVLVAAGCVPRQSMNVAEPRCPVRDAPIAQVQQLLVVQQALCMYLSRKQALSWPQFLGCLELCLWKLACAHSTFR